MADLQVWLKKAAAGFAIINVTLFVVVFLMFADMPYATLAAAFGLGGGAFALSHFVFKIYGRAWLVGALLASLGTFVTGLFYVNYFSVMTKTAAEEIVSLQKPEELFAAGKKKFFKIENVANQIAFAESQYAEAEGLKLNCVVYPITAKDWKKGDSVKVWGAFVTRAVSFDKSGTELSERTETERRLLWVYDDTVQLKAFEKAIDFCAEKQNLPRPEKIIIAEWADIEDEKSSLARKFGLALLILNITWAAAVYVRELKTVESAG